MGKMVMALKKLGNKLTGKTVESDNTVGVINEIADEYEAPDLTPYATKTYVDGLMSGALKRAIVQALPETDIDTNTIYMVLDSEASQQGNVYNEYLYINNAWELIGTTKVSGGSNLKIATVYYSGTEDYYYGSSLTLLIDTSISTPNTYEELVNYLKELGFTSYDKVYPCSGIFNDDGFAGVITSITEQVNSNREEYAEMLKVYGIVNNSTKEGFLNNDEGFSISYLGQEQGE